MIFWEPIIWDYTVIELFVEYKFFNNLNYIFLGFWMYLCGFLGIFLKRKSILFSLISIELMLMGVNVMFLFIGKLLYYPFCQLIVLVLVFLGAAETAIGLTLVLLFYSKYGTTSRIIMI
jgi:NADH-quinone oxidoreductase subunit K